jgi:hypothetical protein
MMKYLGELVEHIEGENLSDSIFGDGLDIDSIFTQSDEGSDRVSEAH